MGKKKNNEKESYILIRKRKGFHTDLNILKKTAMRVTHANLHHSDALDIEKYNVRRNGCLKEPLIWSIIQKT